MLGALKTTADELRAELQRLLGSLPPRAVCRVEVNGPIDPDARPAMSVASVNGMTPPDTIVSVRDARPPRPTVEAPDS